MRTLVVAAEHPWPTNSGSRHRLAATLCGLRSLGPTDLFSIVSETRTDFDDPPPAAGLERLGRVAIDDSPSVRRWARAAPRSYMPFEVPSEHTPTVKRALSAFATGGYDLVWFFRVRAWVLAGEPDLAPAVVDLDDLEDQKIAARLALAQVEPGAGRQELRRWAAGALWRAESRRWRRLHGRIAGRVAATVVCSDLDAGRAGLRGVRVVPNGYPPPSRPVGRRQVGCPPTIVFHGTLRYPPNADAARFLVEQVLPKLRQRVPHVRIRLVGLAPPSLRQLEDPPSIMVTGQVADIDAELAGADLVVVPLRFASGTRIKILEAFAHRIPVVSTAVGAEGLDVQHDVHLLLADDPNSLAGACAVALTDLALRERLVEEAAQLFLERYQSSVTSEAVAEAAGAVVGS